MSLTGSVQHCLKHASGSLRARVHRSLFSFSSLCWPGDWSVRYQAEPPFPGKLMTARSSLEEGWEERRQFYFILLQNQFLCRSLNASRPPCSGRSSTRLPFFSGKPRQSFFCPPFTPWTTLVPLFNPSTVKMILASPHHIRIPYNPSLHPAGLCHPAIHPVLPCCQAWFVTLGSWHD